MNYLFDAGIDFKGRSIQLTGEVGEDFDFSFVDNALSELERLNRKRIIIKLNSCGGSVTEALAIVGRMRSSPCKIDVQGFGVIQSAATMILAAGDKRYVSKYASVMHHQSRYGVNGKHSEVKHQIKQFEKEERLWCKWLEELTIKDACFWYKQAQDDFFFTAEEAIELGMADEII